MAWLTSWSLREVASFTAVGSQRTLLSILPLWRAFLLPSLIIPFCVLWFRFTGYINRIRGYHADKEKLPGYEQGIVNSWYYALADRYDKMQSYHPVKKSFYAREFPTSWRLIDTTLETSWTASILPVKVPTPYDDEAKLTRDSVLASVCYSLIDVSPIGGEFFCIRRTPCPITANIPSCPVCCVLS